MTQSLSQIREHDAPPDVARIFADMRHVMGISLVNLIYRHLATIPGALAAAWRSQRAMVLSGRLDSALDRIGRDVEIPVVSPPNIEITRRLEANATNDIARILTAYNRGNSLNVVGLTAIGLIAREGRELTEQMGQHAPRERDRVQNLPRLLALDEIEADTARRVRQIAGKHGGGTGVVPSLYLHLAHWPPYLRDAIDQLTPLLESGAIERSRRHILSLAQAEAERIVSELPSVPARAAIPEHALATMSAFSTNVIPEMIPVGLALAAALSRSAPYTGPTPA